MAMKFSVCDKVRVVNVLGKKPCKKWLGRVGEVMQATHYGYLIVFYDTGEEGVFQQEELESSER